MVDAWEGRGGAVADLATSEIVRERVREQLVPDLRGPWLAWSGAQAGARLELVVDLPMPALEGGERTTHPTVRVLDVVVEVRAASLGTRATWVTEAEGAGAWADDAVLRVLAPRLVPRRSRPVEPLSLRLDRRRAGPEVLTQTPTAAWWRAHQDSNLGPSD